MLCGVDAAADHIDLRGLAGDIGDLIIKESGSATAGTLATTITVPGTQTGDAIALRGVSADSVRNTDGFLRF